MSRNGGGWGSVAVGAVLSVGWANVAFAETSARSPFVMRYALWALALGAISATSLLLGSILGLLWKPKPVVTAAFIAFGGGALLAALSVELVAPTAMAVIGRGAGGPEGETHGGDPLTALIALLIGSAVGGVLFVI
ncbi:MAG: hypothetical protein O3A46_08245, partial [Candidatus Poribacteria bacterium]|nr:hypothetical protein [Candidatus Poribacteria bacterium]